MKATRIYTMEQWEKAYKKIKQNGWRLFQFQYKFDEPTGFHAWYSHNEKETVEVVTFNEEVEKAIIKYPKL